MPSQATLGQPLDLSIPIRLDDSETLSTECISADIHFGDNRQQPGVVSLALEPALPGASERVLRVLTNTRIDEPYVTVELALGCQSKVARRFTLFADPPLFTPPVGATAGVASRATGPNEAARAVAPAAVAPAQPAVRRARRAAASDDRGTLAATGGVPAAPAAAGARPGSRTAAAAPSGPRLQLTPLDRSARPAPRQERESSLAAEAAASAEAEARQVAEAASAAEQARKDRTRVEQLEASLQRLRAETAQTQQTMRGLQAQVQSAEAARFSNPLVFMLLFLIGMLLLGLVWLWRLRIQDRAAAAWLGDATRERERSTEVDTAEAIAFAPASLPTAALEAAEAPAVRSAATRAGEFDAETTQVLPRSSPPVATLQSSEPARRAVSAEELIDLEQQAEFFIVLGQEEAAIDLLMGHLRSTSGTSPLPYLKLLELYRKRGNRREYERVRERFNMRFSAYAPDWELDLNDGRALEDYPSVIGRLQALWPTPSRALEVLQLTLARPEGEPQASESFELPAYRELMLLYSVARELAEGEPIDTRSGVDLLLPIGDELEPISLEWREPVVERLTATAAVPAQPGAQQALHVDLPLDLPLPSAVEAAAAPVAFRSTTIEELGDDDQPSEAGRTR
ncbi:hypothetical protein EV670_3428 [Rivibacter subsaxonicus]|uniref:Tfp pilus assembly protein FimV n=1 Tax=Rivibacter subsaxonicus TaxID=457575 RepID=A0A4Q7VAS0_9BURK|nr:hypothetical protein EV670_3428 [Rivibacter subsaxonicus]